MRSSFTIIFGIFFFTLAGFFVAPKFASAAVITWDGGGNDILCLGVGTANNWSCGSNWSGDVAPGASDIATFDTTSTKNATIDASISVAGIDINSGYTGIITQGAGFTVTVGTSDFDISAGTFTGGDSTITMNDAFTVSGGTFTSTTGNMSVSGAFTVSSGTFSESTGTVTATGGTASTWNVVTSEQFNNLTINKTGGTAVNITSGDTLIVTGTFTMTDGAINTGTVDTRGNSSQASTFDGGSATVDFGDDGVAQTYTVNGGTGPGVRLDSAADASDSITYAAAGTLTALSITSGFSGTIPISNGSDFALTFTTWTQDAGTIDASAQSSWLFGDFNISAGSFTAPTTVTATGGTGVAWDVVTSQTFNNLTINKTGGSTLTITSGDTLVVTGTLTLTDGNIDTGTIDTRGNISQASTFDGGSAIVDFGDDGVAQTYTVNGGVGPTVRLNSAADASDSITYTAASTLTNLTTTSGFSGAIPISNASNFTLTFTTWSQAAGTYDASAQSAWTFGTLTISGGSFTAPTTTTAGQNSNVTWDISTSQTFNNLTIAKSNVNTVTIASGDTLVVTGTLTLTDGRIGTGTVDARGNITQASTFDGSSATIDFGDDGVAQTYTVNGGITPIIRFDSAADASDSLTFTTAATVTELTATSGFSGAIPITNSGDSTLTFTTWTQDAGTYDGSAQTAWNIGTFTRSAGSFTAPTTVTSNGANVTWNVPTSQTFNNFTRNGTSALGITSGDTLIITGTLTLTNGTVSTGTLEAQAGVTVQSTYDGGNAPLTFSGTANQSFDLTGATGLYNGDININKTSGQVNLASDLVMDAASQDLTIVEGTLDLVGHALTVNGTSGTFVVQDGGVFELYGNETITLNASNPTLETGSTVRFTGDGDAASDTFTVTTLSASYYNLIINSTDGATDTYQLGAAIDMNGAFTLTAGTFDVTTSNFAMTVGGDWSNSGTFTARSGTVTLDGTDQTMSGATTFNNFTKSVAAAATLTLPASTTQTFLGTMTLAGASAGNRLSLRSSSAGTRALIDPQGTRTVSYLDVKDNNNANATAITCSTSCFDSGNNLNWLFPGIQVSAISGNTTEAGGTATFTVVLGSQPTGDVTIPIASDDTTEGTIAVSTLTFTDVNWSTPQTITVTGVNDFVDDGDIAYNIVLSAASSTDPVYDTVDPSDVAVTNTDNDTAGVTVSAISGNTTEAGGTATFTVVLDSQPTGDVVIDSASNDSTEGTVTGGSQLTFTTANWSTPQTVTVTGVDDALNDGDIAYTIVVTTNTGLTADALYDAIDPSDVSVTNTDDENPDISVSTISGNTTEAGGTATFTVVLTTLPTDDVTIPVASNDTTEGTIAISTLTFTTGNWSTPQTVTVTGVDDSVDDGNIAYSIVLSAASSTDPDYNNLNPADVSVTNTDNDTAGVTVSAISSHTTEAGGTATFTMVLTSQPTGDVVIDSASDDSTEGTVTGGSQLTFTTVNWATPQTVTVTGVDDFVDDGNITYSIVTTMNTGLTADATYDAINPNDVTVINDDDDGVGVTVSTISGNTTETLGTATFTVVLDTMPTGNVEIDSVSDDSTEGTVTGGATLTFTTVNWATPQTVTVTGVNDFVDDGNIAYNILVTVDAGNTADPAYDAVDPSDVSVTNTDNDTSGVTVTTITGHTTELGGSATFTMVLTSQPTGDVVIDSASNDSTEGTVTSNATVTFTSSNWSTPQTITVTGVDDVAADGDISYTIVTTMNTGSTADALYDAVDPDNVSVINNDNDSKGITVSSISGPTTENGGTATFTVVLNALPTGNVEIDSVSSDLTEGVITAGSTLTFTTGNWDTPQTVTITGQDDVVSDGSIGYTIFVSVDTGNTADSDYDLIDPADVSVSNSDNETAGITVSAISGNTTEAGGTATFTVVLNSQPTDNVVIDSVTNDSSEGTVTGGSALTFTTINWATPQTVTVTGADDSLDDGDIGYTIVVTTDTTNTLDSNYDIIEPDDVSVVNTDNDVSGFTVSAISGNTTEAGGTATFTVVLNAQPTASVSTGVSSNDTGEGTVSPASLTFTTGNWSTPQTVTVTGVDDSVNDGNIAYTIVLAAATSSDTNYDGINPSDVSVTNTDDDSSAGGGTTPEIPPVSGGSSEDTITVTYPNGGEVFLADEETIISWETTGANISHVNIALSTDGGASFNTLASDEINDGFYVWIVPDINTTNARILIEGTDLSTLLAYDVSNSVFSIIGTQPVVEEPPEETPSDPSTTDSDGDGIPDSEEIYSISEIQPGDYIKGVSFDTVFWMDNDLKRHPFYDEQTFFTYEDSFDVIKLIADEDLPAFRVSSPRLPKPGVILVKIKSQPYVYHVDTNATGDYVLHWIPTEALAAYLVGDDWRAQIIDLPPTVWIHYLLGSELTVNDTIDSGLLNMTRLELNSH